MAYTDIASVRLITGLTTSDISDADITSLITYATAELNNDINFFIRDELVQYIDSEKENKIDGSNKTFYLKEITANREIGDYDNDGDVDTSDFYLYTIDSSTSPATRTALTVTTLTSRTLGKIVVSSAPSTNQSLYVSYTVAPIDENTPHQLIKMAATQLVSAYAFTKINAKKIGSFTLGKIKVTKQSDAFELMYSQYERTVAKINAHMSFFEKNISGD